MVDGAESAGEIEGGEVGVVGVAREKKAGAPRWCVYMEGATQTTAAWQLPTAGAECEQPWK